jgi:hypothetical protein
MVFQMIYEEAISGEAHALPRADFKNVRLTCKMFEELATPFLLPRIIRAPLSDSLAVLTAVSLHPVFSRSVTEIISLLRKSSETRRDVTQQSAILR